MLASASPQRRAILARLGVAFEIRVPGVSELEQGEPRELTVANARRKARAVASGRPGEAVIACDTVVSLQGRLFGKPADAAQARATLQALSACTHTVVSGLVVLTEDGERTAVAATRVSFRELGGLLDWYLAGGEWRGRAGAYAIQGAGAALVRGIEGDYENVVGLPVASLLDVYPELLAAP